MSAAIEARSIGVTLGGRAVLAGIDLSLAAGTLTAVVGPNGAGKSTLLRALAGLLPATGGQVHFGGRPLATMPAMERARAIAWLPQAGTVAWPMRVRDLVMLGRWPHGANVESHGPRDAEAVRRALEAVAMTELAGRDATRISGGERNRALLARALAVGAPVLLCDEPLAALDPAHQLHCLAALRAEAGRGVAVAAVMHDLAAAARTADRVLVLNHGRAEAFGPPAAVLAPQTIARVFGVRAEMSQRDGAPDLRLLGLIDRSS